MRVLSLILLLLGAVLLLLPGLRDVIPRVHLADYVWQWISFVCIGFAALLWFLAPKDD